MTTDSTDFEPAYCRDCSAPVVLAHVDNDGWTLVCGCQTGHVPIDDLTNRTSRLDPVGGVWTGDVLDADP